MKCYYEILDIPRDAEAAEIKSAYRKCALRWHPDKNLDNTQAAKEQFQLVQQAYEVLSDPHERAWYDKHREQILRGSNSEFEDNSLDVYKYFNTTCFKGYGDDEKGFYTVYRNVFDEIVKEDLEYFEDKDEFCSIPRFGNSQSDYDAVNQFYAHWMSYNTKKSFVWLDTYDIRETRDRKTLKLMEKENKKIRDKAKKERNEEVRNLVAFVRKRDKRVQEHSKLLEAKKLQNREKHKELTRLKKLERKKELDQSASTDQAEWSKFDNLKHELEQIEKHLAEEFGDHSSSSGAQSDGDNDDDNDDDYEEILNELYCEACNKLFKTPNAFENHSTSKKHKENVAILREIMLDEEEPVSSSESENDPDLQADPEKKDHENHVAISDSSDGGGSEIDLAEDTIKKQQKRKKKKQKNVLKANHSELVEDVGTETMPKLSNSDQDFDFESQKRTKRKNARKDRKSNKSEPSKNSEHNADESSTLPEDQQASSSTAKNESTNAENVHEENATAAPSETRKTKNTSKKKHKVKENVDVADLDLSHCCVTCHATFPSKNKLFGHLKDAGHGVYLPKDVKNKKNGKEKKVR